MNPGGVRADLLLPSGGGTVSYGQIFSVQPFGNTLVVKSFTGQQVKDILEFQFAQDGRPRVLFPSAQLRYSVDLKKPPEERVGDILIKGMPRGRRLQQVAETGSTPRILSHHGRTGE